MKINLKEHLSLTEKRNAKSDLLFSRKEIAEDVQLSEIQKKGLAFILPSFAGVCIFWLIPYVDVIRRSFCGAVNGEFVGIENYRTIFANKAFRLAAGNTLRFFGVCVPLLVVLSLIIAVLLAGQKRFTQILKSFFFYQEECKLLLINCEADDFIRLTFENMEPSRLFTVPILFNGQ